MRMWKKQYIREEKTDWQAYYSQPKSRFASSTQKFTLKKLLYFIEKYKQNPMDVMELGGGSSCFAEALLNSCKTPIKSYSIVDNCLLAVERFQKKDIKGESFLQDLTKDVDNKLEKKYDLVFSVGLIEHFRGNEIQRLIQTHFKLCKKDGIIIISVPTPTVQYRIIRKVMEYAGVWRFPDEKPLCYTDIKDIIERYGKIEEWTINYKLPLTQMIIIARKGMV